MNAVEKFKGKKNSHLRVLPKVEAKKVNVDDGYTQIPNELLFAMGQFGFTQRQFNVLLGVIQKTLTWHKEMDWVSNSQLCELVDLPDEQKASKTKQELIRMNVLVQQGNKIGINLAVSEWKKAIAQKVQTLHKTCKKNCINHAKAIAQKVQTQKKLLQKKK